MTMFSFLKGEYKERIRGEYKRRLFKSGVRLVVFAGVILVAGILPTYYSLVSQKNALDIENQAASQKMAEAGLKDIESEVKELSLMAEAAKADSLTAPLSIVLERALSGKGSGIAVTSISIERKKDGWSISLGGKALSRDALVAFSKSLEAEPRFSGVDLPVSSLAKNKDIPFTISLRSKL